MKLTIPGRLPGLNEYIEAERSHRQKGAAMKRQAEQQVMLTVRRQLRGKRFTRPVHMAYTWVERDKRRDYDNIAFAKKFVQDALVKAGTLPGDGQKWVVGFTDSFCVDKDNPRIEIEIQEVTHGVSW